jgi:4-hydroxy-tetrahydrodipicolinate synthase
MTATKTQASGAGTASLAMKGVLSPVLTPFRPDLSVHKELLTAQCQWLLNCNVGLAVFGTNSEGNSLSFAERADLVQYLVAQGIDPHRMMPGTGGCALPDVVSLTQACLRAGVKDVLVLPPFYYKGVSDDGLYAFFSELIERVGDSSLRVYLYHIPPVSQIGFSMELIEKLLNKYGPVIAGAKDSGGQWSNTASMIERFSARFFSVCRQRKLFDAHHARGRCRLHQCHGQRQSGGHFFALCQLDRFRRRCPAAASGLGALFIFCIAHDSGHENSGGANHG